MVNIGKIKDKIYSNLLKENNEVEFKKFFDVITKDKGLVYEFYVYNNIKNYKTTNKEDAKMYINTNLALLNEISSEERKQSHNKLNDFKSKGRTSLINENIEKLIQISMEGVNPINLNQYQSSMDIVCEHIISNNTKTLKESQEEEIDLAGFQYEKVLKLVYEKFNEKYSDLLSEEEIKDLNDMSTFNEEKEKALLDKYKEKALKEIESSSDEEVDQDTINECIAKIKSMEYNVDTFIDNIMELNDLLS